MSIIKENVIYKTTVFNLTLLGLLYFILSVTLSLSHQTPSALQQAVRRLSILTALGEEREVHRMKINRVSSGTDAKFPP